MHNLLIFFQHGSNLWLALGVAALGIWAGVGGPALPPLWVVAGALLFYSSEYSWHRFAFHAPPAPWAWLRAMQRRMHYDHHAEPGRLDLLFLPAWFLGPNLALTGLLAWAALGAWAVAPILLGVMLALLHYEWAHYVAHIPYVPRTRFGRWMKQYHLRHHFISEKHWFGVSNPALDVLYRTYSAPADVEKSATTRKLYS